MDLATLKAEHPELLAQVQNDARAEGEQAGRDAGIAAERERVTEIMNAGADPETSKKAIEDGVDAAAAYKMFFEAEKQMRADRLEELNNQAPKPAGQQTPEKPEDEGPADQVLARKAAELAKTEGLPLGEATTRVLAENPELLARYEASYSV